MTGTERDTCIDTRIIDKWTGRWMGKKTTQRDRQTVCQSRDNGCAGQRQQDLYIYEQTKSIKTNRERGKETERDKGRDRDRQTDKHIQTERQRDRQR